MTLYRSADLSPGSEDRAFVLSAWSSSYKSSHFAGAITAEDWATVMHDQLGKVIDRPRTRTIVAWDRPAFLYGFIAGDTSGVVPIVHYVYVKDPFRSQPEPGARSGPRIARGLLEALGVDPARRFLFSCRTPIVATLQGRDPDGPRLPNRIPGGRFVPAALRYADYQERDHHER